LVEGKNKGYIAWACVDEKKTQSKRNAITKKKLKRGIEMNFELPVSVPWWGGGGKLFIKRAKKNECE